MVYSFEDVQATLTGPGGTISLGAGAANAQEGITVEFIDDKDAMTIGADGEGVHSMRASNAARIIVRLLKTSSVNSALTTMYKYQKQSSTYWGQNVVTVTNSATGDDYHATEVAFQRHPSVTWAQDANFNEWTFNAIKCDPTLGEGV